MRKTTLFVLLSLFLSVGLFAQTKVRYNETNQANKPILSEKFENSVVKGVVINLTNSFNVDYSNSTNKGILLHSNGTFVTNPAGGPAGSDYSNLQTGNNSFGFSHSTASFYKVADDFVINAQSWTIDSIAFYAYQTGSTTTSTMTGYRIRIWQGTPGTGTVVWGDTTTNRFARTHWTNCYRGSDLIGTTRPIMRTVCNTPALTLTGGTYWVEYSSTGTLTSGPWAVPITIAGQVVTGNAMQRSNTGVWANLVDGANQQGLPFQIFGTEIAATCPFPGTLSASNITTTSADLAWVEAGSATAWNIEWGVTGFTQGTGTLVNGLTSQNYSLSALTAATNYSFYVQADCGGEQSMWVGPYSFSTLVCEVVNQCNFTLTFYDSFGDGWNGASVTVKQNGATFGTYTLASGSTGSQVIGLCDAMNTELVFTSGSYPEECGFAFVGTYGDTLTSFTDGSTLTGGAVFFTFTTSCTPPACPKPTALTATSITLTSANLGWTEAGTATAWNVEYGASGFTQGTGTTVAVSANPYTLTGLTSATAYSFYVQADCGGAQSQWVGPFNFTTACSIISVFPWSESFEGASFPPACWTKANLDGGTGWASIAAGTTPLPGWTGGTMTVPTNGGTKAAYCTYSTGGAASNDQWLISPNFNIPATGYSLFAEIYWFGSYAENLDIKVSNTGNQTTDFATTLLSLDTLDLIQAGWKLFEINLDSYAGQNVFIGFNEHVTDNQADGAFIGLDLVRIDFSTSNSKIDIKKDITIYPNPTTGMLNINNVENSNIVIYNVLGEVVSSVNNASNFVRLDLNNLSKGTYIVKIINDNTTITKQITLIK